MWAPIEAPASNDCVKIGDAAMITDHQHTAARRSDQHSPRRSTDMNSRQLSRRHTRRFSTHICKGRPAQYALAAMEGGSIREVDTYRYDAITISTIERECDGACGVVEAGSARASLRRQNEADENAHTCGLQ